MGSFFRTGYPEKMTPCNPQVNEIESFSRPRRVIARRGSRAGNVGGVNGSLSSSAPQTKRLVARDAICSGPETARDSGSAPKTDGISGQRVLFAMAEGDRESLTSTTPLLAGPVGKCPERGRGSSRPHSRSREFCTLAPRASPHCESSSHVVASYTLVCTPSQGTLSTGIAFCHRVQCFLDVASDRALC